MIDANVCPPKTTAGEFTEEAKEPTPSWRTVLLPQQYADPVDASPQLTKPPPAIAAKVNPPATTVGTTRWLFVPSPTTPELLLPQQYAAPVLIRPQV